MNRYEVIFKYKGKKFKTKIYRANNFGSLKGMIQDMMIENKDLKGAMITNLLTEEFVIV